MGESTPEGRPDVVCYVCGKAWPTGTDTCPDDGTWLSDETTLDVTQGGQKRRISLGDLSNDVPRAQSPAPVEGEIADPTSSMRELPRGTIVGEYEIEGKIGEGAMGAVYRAVHPTIGRLVAIKVISPEILVHPDAIQRFVSEARAVAAIRHPGIVHVFGFGRLPDGRTYLTMEWLEGQSLGGRLRQGRMSVDETCEVLRQIARALEAAHAKSIVHRDLKPENVYLQHVDGEAPIVKLLDFGLAKNKDDGQVARTRTGQILGTPLYMSPEQCKAKGVDERTDIYALGCLAYEMFVGKVPFDFDNAAELMSAHLVIDPPHARDSVPDLAEGIDELIFRMMSKDPAQRPSLTEVRLGFSTQLMRNSMPMGAVTIEDVPAEAVAKAVAENRLAKAAERARNDADDTAPVARDGESLDDTKSDTISDPVEEPAVEAPRPAKGAMPTAHLVIVIVAGVIVLIAIAILALS